MTRTLICLVAIFILLGAVLYMAMLPGPVPEYVVEHSLHVGRWYPYSVVPGGVRSAAEVEQAVANDPVVAEHYKGIYVAGLVPVESGHYVTPKQEADVLTESEGAMAFVSYRVGNRISWTRHKVFIKDAILLEPGTPHFIRQRCGNLISLNPPEVTEQPPPVILPPSYLPPIFAETPFPMLAPPRLPGAPEIEYPPAQVYPPLQTAQAPGWYGFPLPIVCCFGGVEAPERGHRRPRMPRPRPRPFSAPVPESGTWGLLSLGCLILLVKRCNH